MAIRLSDYLIDQNGIDWGDALKPWAWLLPPAFTLWIVNRFAHLFVIRPDGTVRMLDVGSGSFEKVAESRDEFCTRIDADDNAGQWLKIALVDCLVAAGIDLPAAHCYGFKVPPVMGGEYIVENCGPLPIGDYLGACGSIHEQLRDVPDGSQVILKVVNLP